MTNRQTKLAYCAGILDGEGSIGVQIAKPNKTRKTNSYRVRVRVAMCDIGAITLLQELFGGSIKTRQPKNLRHRMSYDWIVRSLRAKDALTEMLPYLIIKRERAQIAIELIDRVSSNRVTITRKKIRQTSDQEVGIRHDLYTRIFKLNERVKYNTVVPK